MFYHIPKTGGTWVHAMLSKSGAIVEHIGSKHLTPRQQERLAAWRHVGPHPFRFCFVRSPTNYLMSLWKHFRRRKWKKWGSSHPWGPLDSCMRPDFHDWLRVVLRKKPDYVTWLYKLYQVPGKYDFIGKQENLRYDLADVLTQLGLAFDAEYLHTSRRRMESGGEPVTWDEGLKRKVQDANAWVYDTLGYRRGA